MTRRRDHRAEYERRNARARSAGYPSYGAQRRAQVLGKSRGRGALSPRELEAVKAKATRRQIHDTGAGRSVGTTARGKGQGVIAGQLRGHGSNPVRLQITTKDGRRRELYGRGRSARDVLAIGVDMADIARQVNQAEDSRYGGGDINADDIADVVVELLEGWPT